MLTLIFLLISNLYAGQVTGNGGDILVCDDNASYTPSVELLDFYEGKFLNPDAVSPFSNQKELKGILDDWINRIKSVDSSIYEKVLLYREDLMREFEFVFEPLPEIDDTHHEFIHFGCELRQLAVQVKDENGVRYLIDKKLFNQLPPINQAGLFLHEMIYRYTIYFFNASDSRQARMFNYYISTNQLEKIKKFEKEN
jgi:hypothetical protein